MELMSEARQKVVLQEILGRLFAWHAGQISAEELQDTLQVYLRENTSVAIYERIATATTPEEFSAIAELLLKDSFAEMTREQERERQRLREQFRVSQDSEIAKSASLEVQFLPPPKPAAERDGRPWFDPIVAYERLDGLIYRMSLGLLSFQSFFVLCTIGILLAFILTNNDDRWLASFDQDKAGESQRPRQTPAATDVNAPADANVESDATVAQQTGAPTESQDAGDTNEEAEPSRLIELRQPDENGPSRRFSFSRNNDEGSEDNAEPSRLMSFDREKGEEAPEPGSKLLAFNPREEEVGPDLNSVLAGHLGVSVEELDRHQGRSEQEVGLQGILKLLDEGQMDEALNALSRKSAAFSERNVVLIKMEILASGNAEDRAECWEMLLRNSEQDLASDLIAARLLLTAKTKERNSYFTAFKNVPGAPALYGSWVRSWTKDKAVIDELERHQAENTDLVSAFLDRIFLANALFNQGRASDAHDSLAGVPSLLASLESDNRTAVYASLVIRNRDTILERVNGTLQRIASTKID